MQFASDRAGGVRFGVFELDFSSGELRKRGIRLKLQDQPLRILALLLAQPGEIITRDQLRRALWPDDTFVDFDHGLNAAVAKLRQTLGDVAENPRFIETVPRRGYRFIAPIDAAGLSTNGECVADTPLPGNPGPLAVRPPASPNRRLSGLVVAAVVITITAAAGLGVLRWEQPSERVFTRLTSDTGLTTDPAISPDGSLVAYASDRGGGRLHICVPRPVPGSDPLELTRGDWDDRQPAFSPDGDKIVFRSERDGGGVYVVPSLGGQPVLIAKQGRNPRFSPDGKWIAYWTGLEWGAMRGIAQGHVFVVPPSGGEPIQISGGLGIAGMPVWSPSGEQLLVFGEPKKQAHYHDAFDWWVLPVNGGQAIKTGAYTALAKRGISLNPMGMLPFPRNWTSEGVLFSAQSRDSVDLWSVAIASRTFQITDTPFRFSRGTGFMLAGPASGQERVAFADVSHRMHLWSLPLNANRGTPAGQLEQTTDSAAAEYWPNMTPDGKRLAFTSGRSGTRQTWLKDLATGKETAIPMQGAATGQEFPRISPDGNQVAYTMISTQGAALSIALLEPALQRTIPNTNDWVWGWSPDGRYLLCKAGALRRIDLLDISRQATSHLLEDPEEDLWQASFSPDARWILFGGSGGLYIAPFHGLSPIPRQDWIVVARSGYFDDKPRWSPDGNLFYFTSDRDGWRCIWAQALNPVAKEPVGDPWPVQHFHTARRSLLNVGNALAELAVAPKRLIFPLDEISANVWLMEKRK